jgi:predicted transposase/invertase (TIGR01784 family)
MSGFLDPRSDLVFRRIFGEHPEILVSFLNAMLPLDSPIVSLQYLPIDQIPVLPVYKRGIVDVKCVDEVGRHFIVEMQVQWTAAFLQRVLFNASQAYVKQLEKGEAFHLLQPVMALSLLDDTFIHDSDEYYHHYKIVNVGEPQHCIEGLQFVFVELPKFRETKPTEARKLRWAWLRFLREASKAGEEGYPSIESFEEETALNPPLREAMRIARESNFTRAERNAYDRFWDVVRTERTLIEGKTREALEQGMAQGLEQGMAQGLEQGMAQGLEQGLERGRAEGLRLAMQQMVARLVDSGMSEAEAKRMLGLNF